MTKKEQPLKRQPLTAAIISYMKPGEERADAQFAGLRVRSSPWGLTASNVVPLRVA